MFWILESLKLEPCGLMVLENCLTSQIIVNINLIVPVNVLASTEGGANGVFIDGCHFTQLTGLSDQELQDFNSVILR